MEKRAFMKLSKLKGMTTKHFQRMDYDILWAKLSKDPKFGRMDYFGFYHALEILSVALNTPKKEVKNTKPDPEQLESLIEMIHSQL